MSFLDRLTRAFSTFSSVELDDRAKIGALGEQYAAQVIHDSEGSWIRNPIIPHPTKPGYTLETDFLVYTKGNLFCVEIKNYKGRISYAQSYRTARVEQGGFFGSQYIPQNVFDGFDDSRILQEKIGNCGEGIFTKEYPNPLKKTKYYIHHLKNYLSTIDGRFQRTGFFSAQDQMTVHYMNGGTQVFQSVSGEIHLHRVEEHQVHKLRNVNRIIVGVANKLAS